jgi:NAD(P)-dependent dehydrogenase (short-subunit alcohol dehydrogenase family)
VEDVESSVGAIDVLIVNAGYGVEGTFEETPLSELRAQFEVNVFGAAATVRAVLPYKRERRRGHILAVTSMGGLAGFPGVSAYCGSKYALEGILEAVGKEVAGFGIHVTAIEPGSFRTDWAGRSMVRVPRSIPDYDELFEPIRAARQAASGNQLGDPDKAAAAVLRILDDPDPPAHLVLGSDALRLVRAARADVDKDLDTWEELSRSTDFPDGHQIAQGAEPRGPRIRSYADSAARRAREVRSSAVRPGQPCTFARHSSGTADAPWRAPRSAPAIAATVSVSSPARTAANRPSGSDDVCVTADQAACSAGTTKPFGLNRCGGAASASSSQEAHLPRRDGGRYASPSRTPS